MHSDMYHQYVPFLEEFVRKVRDGEPLYYSLAHRYGLQLPVSLRLLQRKPVQLADAPFARKKIFNRIYELHGRFQNRSVRLHLFLAFDRKIPHKRPFCPVLFPHFMRCPASLPHITGTSCGWIPSSSLR